MIVNYLRPQTIPEAIDALRKGGKSVKPLAGGTTFKQEEVDYSVIDLQNLELDEINETEKNVTIGSMVTIEKLMGYSRGNRAIEEAILIQASKNQREQGTIGGLICSENGRSPLLTLFLAMDPEMSWEPDEREIKLSDWLTKRGTWKVGLLITDLRIEKEICLKFASIGRSPYDRPIFCIAMCKWKSGRLRIAAGGFGEIPITLFDGEVHENLIEDCVKQFKNSGDQWASAEYRMDVAKTIITRLLSEEALWEEGLQ